SQIMPTQHEVHSCYLLNVGAAVFHYGEQSRALLTSFPQLYHRSEDLYPLINQRRVHIDENIVSFERNLKELQVARELALAEQEKGNQVLTLVDGSLIPFSVNRNADKIQNDLIERYGIELDAFNAAQLPLIGYISHSRSSDLVNVLRVWRCPYSDSKCQMHCGNLDEEDFPCSEIWPLSDRQLMYSKTQKNSRSAFFHSSAHWSTAMQTRNWVCFAYLNTGQEAARIEIPHWLFEDKKLLEFSLSALLLQIKKGHGYPITLSEAHNMAVIRQADRSRFFQLLGQHLMQGRQQRVELSPKESKKRRGIV
ncbi:MAG: DNA double-strand break repair nuclease NurA, partial [Candidatus Obscuribacterales bacterium]|nr:DNA double-strand break repair nuclease NurA [Candidatus Obscuribacterales bacterium]